MSPARRPPRRAGPPADREGALLRVEARRGREFYSLALGEPPSVRGERLRDVEGRVYRHWDPARSKLGAALVLGWGEPLPRAGERWLYLGAAAGTTPSHLADLVGPGGAVYAVEPSVRPFLRLLEVADRYPNLFPILGDGREPARYGGSVPIVDGIYADVAQPDQAAILAANATEFLRPGGAVLFVVKTASIARDARAEPLLERTVAELPIAFQRGATQRLEPFDRRHFLVGGRWGEAGRRPAPSPPRPILRSRSGRPGRP